MNTDIRTALAAANRILVHKGVLDAYGHISARDPERPDRFLLSRNLAPGLVTPADIIAFDLDGAPIDDDRPVYLERFIHAAIYAARPDVQSVVHSHAPDVLPFSVTAEPLKPIMHMAGFLGAGASKFDLHEVSGDGTDLLIKGLDTAGAVAASLGDGAVVLMRGHGFVTAAASVPLAVYQSIYTQVNAHALQQARALGEVTYLSIAEARSAREANDGQVGRAWKVWCERVAID